VPSTLKIWQSLADPTRLRIIPLLYLEELTVSELQEVLAMGQSRISTHLAQMKTTGLLKDRREGKSAYYSLKPDFIPQKMLEAALDASKHLPERQRDEAGLKMILQKRKESARLHFNQVAGRFDRSYGPGRSWQALSHMLLHLVPHVVIADLGSGEGLVSQLLARKAKHVIAVDNSEKMVTFGRGQAKKKGLKNLEFRKGDLEQPPLEKNSVDIVLLSQALHHAANPERAICAAYEILRKNGQILILDLHEHRFDQAREFYGDHWLGFSNVNLHTWLKKAGFHDISVEIVARENQPPHFQSLLASGQK